MGYVKYPRTWHLPWSLGRTADDRVLTDFSQFLDQDVVVTTKMDGECTTMYSDYVHARSIDGRNHVSRNWVKNLQAKVGPDIPEGFRICGENLFATHSIKYHDLPSYFLVFSIWNEQNTCLSWDDTVEWCDLLGLLTVPVIYRGKWDLGLIQNLYPDKLSDHEGYVVRLSSEFGFAAFRSSVAKFVRANHVQTTQHWLQQPMVKNLLRQ